jgi:hypothetical protein
LEENTVINADAIARTHFTRKVDGAMSFEQFKRTIGLKDEKLPFEYEGGTMIKGKPVRFIAEAWGGFENASGEWTIFISWRSTKGNVTQYIHWTWNDHSQTCANRRDYSFVG